MSECSHVSTYCYDCGCSGVAEDARGAALVGLRAVLAEALVLIEQLQKHSEYEEGRCVECKESEGEPHKPDCRYIRVTEALGKLVGP